MISQTKLYKIYDAEETLLYVGVSISILRRFEEHLNSTKWSKTAATIKIETFDKRSSAIKAEELAIKSENPIFNI